MDSLKYLKKSITPIQTLSKSQKAEKTSAHCIINIVAESVTQQGPTAGLALKLILMPTSERRKRVYLAVYGPGDRSQGSGLSLRPGLSGCEGLSTGLPGNGLRF